MAKWAGLKTARKQRHSWGDIEAVMKAISEYMETSGQDGSSRLKWSFTALDDLTCGTHYRYGKLYI